MHRCCEEKFLGPAGNANAISQQLLVPEESRRRELDGRQSYGERGGEEREQRLEF